MGSSTIFVVSLFAAVISWKVFEWFSWSRSKGYRKSRWEYYKSKISFSLTAFILCLSSLNFIKSVKEENQTVSNKMIPERVGIDNNKLNKTTSISNEVVDLKKNIHDTNNKKSNESNRYTDGDIFELEEQVQYHGDDPIVRSRLGLPPKNN